MNAKAVKSIVTILIIITVLFGLNYWGGHQIRQAMLFATSKAQVFFWRIGRWTSQQIACLISLPNAQREIERLKAFNYELIQRVAELKGLEQENQALRQVLRFKQKHPLDLIMVQPLSKFTEQDSILLDKGSVEGVKKSMPLITAQGVVVGKVKQVFPHNAIAVLITDSSMKFDVQIRDQKEPALGVVQGQGGLRARFQMVAKEKTIAKGDQVVTSALGNIFPDGLLVGEVLTIEQDPINPFHQGRLRPYFFDPLPQRLFLIK